MKNSVNENKKCTLLATSLVVIQAEKNVIISQFNCDFEALKKLWYEVFFSSILQWHYRPTKNIFLQFIENNTLQTNQQLWLPQTFIDVHSLFYRKRLHLYSNGYIWQNGYSANWLCLKSQQLHNRSFSSKAFINLIALNKFHR